MKEAYFSTDSYEQTAQKMLQQVLPYRTRRPFNFDPKSSALLVLDMQNYFLEPDSHAYIPSAEAIIPGLQQLVKTYKKHNLPIIFTRHINMPEDDGLMATWWRDLITADRPTSEITPALDTSAGVVIQKSQYDAFYKTRLDQTVREKFVKQITVCGVMTHLCCETTARSAFMRGFEVFFLIDGTATYNQQHHMASLLNLAHGFATPVRIGEILSQIEKDHAG